MDENPYKAPVASESPGVHPKPLNPYRLKAGDVLAMALVALTFSSMIFALVNFMAARN